jgi:hypothetical protein
VPLFEDSEELVRQQEQWRVSLSSAQNQYRSNPNLENRQVLLEALANFARLVSGTPFQFR